MKKTKFFSEDSIDKLQRNVNGWLSKNKSIGIIRTDMQVATVTNKASYCFYILYDAITQSESIGISEEMEAIIPSEEPIVKLAPEKIIPPDKDIFNKV